MKLLLMKCEMIVSIIILNIIIQGFPNTHVYDTINLSFYVLSIIYSPLCPFNKQETMGSKKSIYLEIILL